MQFRIPKVALLAIALAVLGAVAGAVAVPLTSAPTFCASCHTIKPSYDTWAKSSHKEVTCVACHVRPTFEGFLQDKVLKGTHDVWVTIFGRPKKPEDLKATVYSEVCLSCHRNMLRISEIAERDLPGPLKKAGLIMEHRKHMEAFQKRGKGEGCTTCHEAHGSVNAKMLTARDANLCLKCHFQQIKGSIILIGGSDHTTRLQQGTCWSAGCHEAVHGSRVNSSLRF